MGTLLYISFHNCLLRLFSIVEETTVANFSDNKYHDFLKKMNVFGKGLWRRECQIESLG